VSSPSRPPMRARLTRKAWVPAPAPKIRPGRRPRVSVIVPCFNYGRFLPDAVHSVLSQNDVEPEVIIVDDASTDDSAAVAQRIAKADSRVAVVRHQTNTGHVVAFNHGYCEATGDFIVRLDADDLLTSGSLARSVALFDSFPSVGLVYGHPRHFTAATPPPPRTTDRGWTIWSGEDWVAERCRTAVNCITTPEAVIRASVMNSVGPLSTALRFAQDMEMWLRVAAVSDVGRVDGPDQAFHRDHAASMSVSEGAGRLLDLIERRTVFNVLFSGPGSQMRNANELHRTARSALADQALADVCYMYDRGRIAAGEVDSYVDFALATYPDVAVLPHWCALQRRRRIGPRLAPVPPIFTATVISRRIRSEIVHRRWQRTGL
jgi:glycosyltransferase involved in cell wall biosynthesis